MKSSLRRRIANLERAVIRKRLSPAEIFCQSFWNRVKLRMRKMDEGFEQALEALAAELPLDKLEILLAQLDPSSEEAKIPDVSADPDSSSDLS